MKKISYIFFCFALLAVPFFTSCENEPLGGTFFTTPDGSDGTDSEGDTDTEECTIAKEAMMSAQATYATASADTYTAACNTYADAIDAAILVCGDTNGALTNLLNAVGDCATVNECLQATAAVNIAKGNFEAATSENVSALCFAYLETLENQIAVCGDAAGLIQSVIDGLPCDNNCENATAATATAQTAFDAVDVTDETAFTQACNALKAALLVEIDACGDMGGALAARVLALGDCTPPQEPGPLTMNVDGVFKNFDVFAADITTSGSLLNILARDKNSSDTFFFRVVINQTGVNVLQDERLNQEGVAFDPVTVGDDVFMDEVTENMNRRLVGTLSGEMEDTSGNKVVITDGMFDIMY